MKSLTGNLSSARGWAVLLILFLGAGLFVAACGEEEVPAPTTPAPPPPAPPPAPEPEPTPEPPATPTGLHVDEVTATSITWHWNAVEGAVGYVVQAGADETWDETDTVSFDGVPFTTETQYTASGLDPETTVYVRVASAAGTPQAPLVSDFSTHVTGMTTAVPLAPAPANLRVKERASDFIEWEWDAVEGVAGYQSQFSTGATFPDGSAGRAWHDADVTTRRVSNLDAESDGYLRVRTYAGTQAEPTFGAWSEGSMASTREPPPAVPLDAPDRLDAAPSDDSITLRWDGVRNAGSYEVGQREPGDDWGDASCGGGNNVVEDEECVASDLDSGTDYDFRVRAVPSDTDRYETSAWSDIEESRTAGDAPREPTAPVPGGMGDLNVSWESTGTSITWIWERVEGKKYDIFAAEETYNDDANPCADKDYPDATSGSSATSHTLDADDNIAAGDVALLCVRTTNEQNPSENLSFAWAVASPPPTTLGTARLRDADDDDGAEDDTTTALVWSGFMAKGGFNYSYRVVHDPQGTDDIDGATTNVQSACDGGIRLKDDETDEDFTDNSIVLDRNLSPYSGYLLCARYGNDAGASAWSVPASNAEAYTRPARPPSPTVHSSLVTEAATETTVVWRVASRGRSDLPRLLGGYNVATFFHRDRKDDPNDGGTATSPGTNTNATLTIKPPTVKNCGTGTDGEADFTRGTATVTTDGDGVVITSGAFGRATADAADATQKLGNSKAYLCVQAKYYDGVTGQGVGVGPWMLSSSYTIRQQN